MPARRRPAVPALAALDLQRLAAWTEHAERCAGCREALRQADRAAVCDVGRELTGG